MKKEIEAGKRNEHEHTLYNVKKAETSIIVIAMVLTVIGVGIYMYEKRLEYKGKFNLKTFFLGVSKCRMRPDKDFI